MSRLHKCRKLCHRPGECEDSASSSQTCGQVCGKTKLFCDHACQNACHGQTGKSKFKTSVVIVCKNVPNKILQLATNHLLVRPRPSSLVPAATVTKKLSALLAALIPRHLGLSSNVTMNVSAWSETSVLLQLLTLIPRLIQTTTSRIRIQLFGSSRRTWPGLRPRSANSVYSPRAPARLG